MAANSSSFTLTLFECVHVRGAFLMSTAFVLTNLLLLLPLSLLVLHLGLRRWRRQRSFAATSHSDVFTFHFAVLELVFVLGFVLFMCGLCFGGEAVMLAGYYVFNLFYPGQICFHILTCVDRYLAVVHPITYLRLKQPGGVRVRNASLGGAWLFYCGWIGVEVLYFPGIPHKLIMCILAASLVLVSFCSLSVLCVLIRPGPGEAGRPGPRVDQAKNRAFSTITAITAVLWLFFIGVFLCVFLDNVKLLASSEGCVLLVSGSWFTLPSSLVLPLLFLQRAGKLVCCRGSSG